MRSRRAGIKAVVAALLMGCLCLFLTYSSYAQTKLYLKSGRTIEGRLIERAGDYIKIDFSGVTLTYWFDEIERVEFEDGEVFLPSEEEAPEETVEEATVEESAEAIEEAGAEVTAEPFEAIEEEPEVFDEGFEREQDTSQSFSEAVGEEEPGYFSDDSQAYVSEEESFSAQGEDELIEKLKEMERASRQIREGPPPGFSAAAPRIPDEAAMQAAVGLIMGGMILFILVVYVYSAFCLQKIAYKTGTANGWFAWIPILNVILMCDIAGKPRWWTCSILLSVIPVVGALLFMIIWVILWVNIARARGKPAWVGVLVLLPLVNFIVIGYLAFSRQDSYEPGVAAANAIEESRRLREEAKKIKAAGAALAKEKTAMPGEGKPDIVYRPRVPEQEKKETSPYPEEIREDVRDLSPGADETTDEGREAKDEKPETEPDKEEDKQV